MRQRIDTEDIVYLHFHSNEPKFIAVCDPKLAELDWSQVLMPVVEIDECAIRYDEWHPIIHMLCENTCKGNHTRKPYRSKRGSLYGRMIRHGSKTGNELLGCADTPLNDIDFIEVESGYVVALGEYKRPHERLTKSQRLVIDACRDAGIEFIEDEH